VLIEAESTLMWGHRVTLIILVHDIGLTLKVSRERAADIVDELVKQGRIERTVASNGHVTLKRRRAKK
jgi:polyhydroxyalkanoate synthesis regulator phasin